MNDAPPLPDAATRLELQAGYCAQMGAPLYSAILRAMADDHRRGGAVRRFFDLDPSLATRSTIGLRLMAALHYYALVGSAPELAAHLPSCGGDADARAASNAARTWIADHPDRLAERFTVTPQTNEVARSMPLLGGVLAAAAGTGLPFRLLDVGSSAGLNARLDRYRYAGDGWEWGDATSPLLLRNRTKSGKPAHLDVPVTVEARLACDLHPLDIARDADRTTLRSYVWADQLERFDRLNQAIEAALRTPVVVEAADMLSWIPRHAVPHSGSATLLMHSVVCDHLAPDTREEFEGSIHALGDAATQSAPFGWLRMELEGGTFATRLTLWPGRTDVLIANSDGHAQDIAWTGSAS